MTTYQDFTDWIGHPTTQFFLQKMEEMRESIKEKLASGALTEATCEATSLKHAEAIGKCTLLYDIINIDAEGINLAEGE